MTSRWHGVEIARRRERMFHIEPQLGMRCVSVLDAYRAWRMFILHSLTGPPLVVIKKFER